MEIELRKKKGYAKPMAETQDKFDEELDLWKYVIDVHSKINDVIKADYTLAKVGDKDKEAIIEMTTNAYMMKKLYEQLSILIKIPTYNEETKKYEDRELSPEEKKELIDTGRKVFDTIMVRVHMTVIMNKNVDNNHLIKILAKVDQDIQNQQATEETKEKEGILTRIKNNMFKKNTNKEKLDEANQ